MSSIFFLRNNLNKLCSKSCFQLIKNFYNLAPKNNINKKSPILNQKQLLPLYNLQVRGGSTQTITIKEYKTSRKYTKIWKLERLMGWSLIILIPLAFAIESKEIEIVLAMTGLMHTYCGCQSMCSDYLRSSVVGKVLPIMARISIVVLTLASLAGFYQLIYEDMGLVNMIKQFWSIRGQDYKPPKYLQKVEQKQNNIFRLFSRK